MLGILHLRIYVLNTNTLQVYFWYTKLVYLKSDQLEQQILYLMHFNCEYCTSKSIAEVQLKIYWSIFWLC